MITIKVLSEGVISAIPDHESPLEYREEVNQDIVAWFEERIDDNDWDYSWTNDYTYVFFRIRDHFTAILFKLTWGGQQ